MCSSSDFLSLAFSFLFLVGPVRVLVFGTRLLLAPLVRGSRGAVRLSLVNLVRKMFQKKKKVRRGRGKSEIECIYRGESVRECVSARERERERECVCVCVCECVCVCVVYIV